MNDPNEEIFDQIQNDRKHISKNIRYLKKFKELKAKNHQLQKVKYKQYQTNNQFQIMLNNKLAIIQNEKNPFFEILYKKK